MVLDLLIRSDENIGESLVGDGRKSGVRRRGDAERGGESADLAGEEGKFLGRYGLASGHDGVRTQFLRTQMTWLLGWVQ